MSFRLHVCLTLLAYAAWCRPDGYREPALIVGVEADVGDRKDWHEVRLASFCGLAVARARRQKKPADRLMYAQWWPRPLQISQWTMASARGHPVMLDTVRRVVEMALEDKNATSRSVMERTGPGQSSLVYRPPCVCLLLTRLLHRSVHRRRPLVPPSPVSEILGQLAQPRRKRVAVSRFAGRARALARVEVWRGSAGTVGRHQGVEHHGLLTRRRVSTLFASGRGDFY